MTAAPAADGTDPAPAADGTDAGSGPAGGRTAGPLRRLATRTAVVSVVVVGVFAAAALVWTIRAVLGTIFIGFFLALGFDPLVSALARRLHRRGLAVLVFVLGLLVLLVLFAVIVLTPAVTQLGDLGTVLTKEVPKLIAQVQDSNTRIGQLARRSEVSDALKSVASSLPSRITGSVNGILSLVGSVFSGIVKGLSVLALTLYFLTRMPRILEVAGNMVGGGERAAVLRTAASKVGGYVTGQLTVCAAAGVASGIWFFATDVPYPIVLALAVAVLDAVPQIGATAGALVGTVVALTVSPQLAGVTLLFFLAYQQTENYFIAPRLMSRAVDVSAPAVLIAVLIGGGLGGVGGALVALPLTAAGKTVLAHAAGGRFARIGIDLGPAVEAPHEHRPTLRRRLQRRTSGEQPGAGPAAGPPAGPGPAGDALARSEVAEAPQDVEHGAHAVGHTDH